MNLPVFTVMPTFVLIANDISSTDKIIYSYISALTNQKGYCYATNKHLSEVFGVSEKTIQRAVSTLVKKNYLNTVIVRNNEGMVIERRLFLNLETIQKPHNFGMDKNVHRGMDKNVQYNNINNNNIYGAVKTDTEHNDSFDKNEIETNTILNDKNDKNEIEAKQKKTSSKKLKVSDDSIYGVIMSYFNDKCKTGFKASTKQFIKNLDELLTVYTTDDIKNVIDYIYNDNFNEAYWRPSTVFRISNFERNFEFLAKKKGFANQAKPTSKTLYYIINLGTKQILTLPLKPTNIPNNLVFMSYEEAHKALLSNV